MMSQKELAFFFEHACYLMCILFAIGKDILKGASDALAHGYVGHDGFVRNPDSISGCRVCKITGQAPGSVYEVPDGVKFVIYELDGGSHFILAKGVPKSITFGKVNANISYDPWNPQKSGMMVKNITGCRLFK